MYNTDVILYMDDYILYIVVLYIHTHCYMNFVFFYTQPCPSVMVAVQIAINRMHVSQNYM